MVPGTAAVTVRGWVTRRASLRALGTAAEMVRGWATRRAMLTVIGTEQRFASRLASASEREWVGARLGHVASTLNSRHRLPRTLR